MRLLPTSASLLATALLLVQTATGSLVETYSDAACQVPLSQWRGSNGYPNGDCTKLSRNGNFTSFRIINLAYGCAITLYGPGTKNGPCDSSAAPGAIVAQAGTCYNTTWLFASIDSCIKQNSDTTSSQTSKPTSTTHHTSATSSSSSAPSASPTHAHHSSTNIAAIVGGVIGGVAFGIIVAAIGIVSFIRYGRVRRARPPHYPGEPPGSSHGLAEIATKEGESGVFYGMHGGSRPQTSGSGMPGTPGGAQELSTEGIAEVPGHPLVELPSGSHETRGDLGLKSSDGDRKR